MPKIPQRIGRLPANRHQWLASFRVFRAREAFKKRVTESCGNVQSTVSQLHVQALLTGRFPGCIVQPSFSSVFARMVDGE